ncbi:MAG: nitrate/nitrite transporter [Rubrivivax sp.]
MSTSLAPPALAVRIFLAFAFAYFFSALLRAVTATLAPSFSAELGLKAADLGLLAGAYFLGFSALQLPLGQALDRLGPMHVLLGLTTLAVLGCAAFAMAQSLPGLILARALIGMGLAAGLMAPLTCFRLRFSQAAQFRSNSWMLMSGSLGMVASTLPVQWLLPVWGWRGLFWVLAVCLLLAMALMAWWVPADPVPAQAQPAQPVLRQGYREVFLHPVFLRSAPMGFFTYGGMIAVQTLWAGPWMTRLAGFTPEQAAGGLFFVNLGMLLAFMLWGVCMPRLARHGFQARQIMAWGLPLHLVVLAWIVMDPQPATAGLWTLWCVSCTFVSLSQPAVGQAFPGALVGRALSAFNLVIFCGVFCIQWGIGLAIDALRQSGLSEAGAFRLSFAALGVCCALSYFWYLLPMAHRRGPDLRA